MTWVMVNRHDEQFNDDPNAALLVTLKQRKESTFFFKLMPRNLENFCDVDNFNLKIGTDEEV